MASLQTKELNMAFRLVCASYSKTGGKLLRQTGAQAIAWVRYPGLETAHRSYLGLRYLLRIS